MKRLRALIAAVSAVVLVGCASPHVITLLDGSTIESRAEPQFDEKTGFYEFENRAGEQVKLNRDQVLSIKRVNR